VSKIVECVPNFSEGRDLNIIKQITDQIESVQGAQLVDVDPGESTNRTVVTIIGAPDAVKEAAFRAIQKAADLIDMSKHSGGHARFGATDVCPFISVSDVSMEECVQYARELGQRVGEELNISVYLYEHAAASSERQDLSKVRTGEYEALSQKLTKPEWKPDFGPTKFNAKSGVTAIGAREFLIAYNINLNTTDRRYANEIAYEIRERGRWKRTGSSDSPFYYKGQVAYFKDDVFPCGNCDFTGKTFAETADHYRQAHGGDLYERYAGIGLDVNNLTGKPVYKDGQFTHLKAIGWVVEDYNCAQISMNLTNYKITHPYQALEAARQLATERGIVVTGSEIVGVVPFDCMEIAGKFYLKRMMKSTDIPARDVVQTAVQAMGLSDVSEFDIDKKVIGLPTQDGPLALPS